MLIHFRTAALKETRWYEYLIRLVLGGLVTVATGVIGNKFGPAEAGLFLAFPAIFSASATLIEKHERRRKVRRGLEGSRRGKEAAALDAAGAALGSIGLAAFGLIVWMFAQWGLPVLASAAVVWILASAALWAGRQWVV
jgi:hypothetical protein